MAAPGERGWADVTAGIPEIEDEHASLFESPPGVNPGRVMGGHQKSNGAGSRVDTSIRRRPCEDAVRRRRSDRSTGAGVTEVQGDGRFPKSGETGARSAV